MNSSHKVRIFIMTLLMLPMSIYNGPIPNAPASEPINFDKTIYEWSKVLSETFNLVHTKYYQLINPEQPMINAITAFVKSLDPHCVLLTKQAYEDIMQSIKGELAGGIGIVVDNTKEPDDEFLRIIDTIPAGPADQVGIKGEDKIIEIDGTPVKGMSLEEAIAKLKGKPKTTVHVLVSRTDTIRHLSFTLTRDIIKEPNALCYYLKEHNIYYVCFTIFTENSVHQLEDIIKKIQSQNSKGLILDLRNNSGGLLTAVVNIAGLFLPNKSTVLITKGRDNKEIERHITTREPLLKQQIPIFVLVNNYTASAAEILAGCLQVHANTDQSLKQNGISPLAFVVGCDTFGKSSVQELIPISNDCAIKLTTALWELPNNICVQGKGVKPDFVIEQKMPLSQESIWFNNTFGKESALKNSIKVDQETADPLGKLLDKKKQQKKDKEKTWHEKKQDAIASDYLILSTVRLLEMLIMLQKTMGPTATRNQLLAALRTHYAPEDKIAIEEIKMHENITTPQ